MKVLLIHSQVTNSFFANIVCVLSAWALYIHSSMSRFIAFDIVFLECLNNGHNLLLGKYSSVHLLVCRQFNMKTAMKESTNISGRTPLVPFCLRLISISLQLNLHVPFNASLNVLHLLF